MPGEGVAGLVTKAGQAGIQSDLCRWRQFDGDVLAIDGRHCRAFTLFRAFRSHLGEGMLTEGAGLDDQTAGFVAIAVHQPDPHRIGGQVVDEGGDVAAAFRAAVHHNRST